MKKQIFLYFINIQLSFFLKGIDYKIAYFIIFTYYYVLIIEIDFIYFMNVFINGRSNKQFLLQYSVLPIY